MNLQFPRQLTPGYWYRVFMIWGLGLCPRCKSQLAWGQWNDGNLAGRPVCFNMRCPDPPEPAPAEPAKGGMMRTKESDELVAERAVLELSLLANHAWATKELHEVVLLVGLALAASHRRINELERRISELERVNLC